MSFRLLTQGEIDCLRWLAEHGAQARPVLLPPRLRRFVPPLWRMDLVEVWYRVFPHDEPQPLGSYTALTIAGARRVQPFLRAPAATSSSLSSSRRAAQAARSIPSGKRA